MRRPSMPLRRASRASARPARCDAGRVVARRGPAARRRPARGRARERANGPEVVEAGDERDSCRCAAAGRRSASGRRRRTATPARGSSRWCPSRASAAPGRPPPPRPSRPTSRRRCASRSCGLRVGAVVRVLGGEAVGVLVHVERADQHRAGAPRRRCDQRRVARGRRLLALDLRAGQRRAGRRRRTGS